MSQASGVKDEKAAKKEAAEQELQDLAPAFERQQAVGAVQQLGTELDAVVQNFRKLQEHEAGLEVKDLRPYIEAVAKLIQGDAFKIVSAKIGLIPYHELHKVDVLLCILDKADAIAKQMADSGALQEQIAALLVQRDGLRAAMKKAYPEQEQFFSALFAVHSQLAKCRAKVTATPPDIKQAEAIVNEAGKQFTASMKTLPSLSLSLEDMERLQRNFRRIQVQIQLVEMDTPNNMETIRFKSVLENLGQSIEAQSDFIFEKISAAKPARYVMRKS